MVHEYVNHEFWRLRMTSDDQFAHMARVGRLYAENPALQSGEASLNKQPTAGTKLDGGKVRLELIPGELLFAVGDILTFGANKYAARNWEKGIHWGRVYGAATRHLWSWWQGKAPTTKNFLFGNVDGETGKSHLWHAATCLSFLIAYEERGMTAFDDRPEVHLPLGYKTPQDYKRHSNPEGSHQSMSGVVGKYEDQANRIYGSSGGTGTSQPVDSGAWTGRSGGGSAVDPYASEHYRKHPLADRSDPEGGIPGRA